MVREGVNGKGPPRSLPPDRCQQWPHAGCKPPVIHLPASVPAECISSSEPAQTQTGGGGRGCRVRGERTLDVWLEKKSVLQSAGAAPPLGCSTPRFSSASGQLCAGPGLGSETSFWGSSATLRQLGALCLEGFRSVKIPWLGIVLPLKK